MARLEEIKPGCSLEGLSTSGPVSVLNVEHHGEDMVTLTYKDANGRLNQQIVTREDEKRFIVTSSCASWSFNADSELFRLVSEAKRIKLAYLFDPLLAVHTSKITPYPHQITAVYEKMLHQQPLSFLLADDPGAGKTIMAGLLIKELIVRCDVDRCLVVAPGGLVEQWQDELYEKFQLDFDVVSRDTIENSKTGNPFTELSRVIARLDQLSRDEELRLKVVAEDWDLVVCDEAHKLAAHFFGNEVKKTKRYQLGEVLRDHTRHFLLMTATPHNGKEEDFQLFLALLDKDRFEGRFRTGVHDVDVSDIMRRMEKEELLTFEEKKLFPERIAYTKEFFLSPEEKALYDDVTTYVKEEFKRAERQGENQKNVVGFALTILQRRLASSPEAIYQSIRRRRVNLEKKVRDLCLVRDGKSSEIADSFYEFSEEDIEDYEDNPDSEAEQLEEKIVDRATAAKTIPELEHEISTLKEIEKKSLDLRNSEKDSKWEALRDLLGNTPEMFDAKGFRRKLIVFTEHRDTLYYLENRIRRLIGKPEAVIAIHGGVRREDRKVLQEKFTQTKDVVILVATDAAGEGINLQRANLMINYDIPWNPNRIEQRFGRIHRIGQLEVCFLWNLIASDTREGDVFLTLFNKLEEQRRALGGKVFDVLGKVFHEESLRDLLIASIRYGEDPQRKLELQEKVLGVLDLKHINEVLKQNAIGETSLSRTEIQEIREEMERANARKLQPHFIAAFFREAFTHFGGRITEREKGRYEIRYVPALFRQKDHVGYRKILTKYERVCFDKSLTNIEGKPTALFLCPGHPLFDSVLDIAYEKYQLLLRQGAVLIDQSGELDEPAILYYIEHRIDDERVKSNGENETVSRRVDFVYITKSGKIISAGYAPYLDCRAPKPSEVPIDLLKEAWIQNNPEKQIIDYTLTNIVPREFQVVFLRRKEQIEKTARAIRERLTKEIIYWDNRANELKQKELEGKSKGGFSSGKARQKADELEDRMKKRFVDLEKQKHLINRQPFIIGGAFVVPQRVASQDEEFEGDAESRDRIEQLAMKAVMDVEKELGREPRNVSDSNFGWDIESVDPETKNIYFIEVKGRAIIAKTVTVSSNEIKTGKNVAQDNPEQYVLAIVQVDGEKVFRPKYIRRPFEKTELGFTETSVNFDIRKLMQMSEDPR